MLERDTYPKCFDPYLRYAISSNFGNFELPDGKKERSRLFFLVEFKEAGRETEFAAQMNEAGLSVVLGPAGSTTRFATLHAAREAVIKAVNGSVAFDIWEKYVSRVALSLPLETSASGALRRLPAGRWRKGRKSPGSLLIGVLDDGCPFAAAHFLRAKASTRVRGIWDQNQGKKPIRINDRNGEECLFGQRLLDFNYGLEFYRDSEGAVPAPLRRRIGLDEWIQLHATPTGGIDEDGCYADAGFSSLSRRLSHGAHVMDVLAGRVPTSSRVGPAAQGDRRDPPSWRPGADPASKADVVFVQFPHDCIRDATGVWLKAYVLDGIRYVLSFADPGKTKNVIINISYGPTTGPHDGTAELEEALTALVAEFDGTARKPKLEIVLAAGNTYLSEGHVVYARSGRRPDRIEWTWRLPPDNPVLCFAELWMDNADPGPVSVMLTSPGGAVSTSGTGPVPPPPGVSLPPHTGVYAPIVWGSHTMWLLAVEPTRGVAEHGDWKIEVSGIPQNAQIHAYVARSDPNLNVRTGAKLSYFLDHTWEMTRSSEASCKYNNGEFDRTGSLIRRDGTLNGIATAKDPGVHVAGGYIIANGRKSSYSSAGPARSGPLALRLGPDNVLPCDESHALLGIRAGGNRSGGVFRLIGTSAAAPQLARHIADPPIPPAVDPPTQPEEIAKRGGGNIEPP
ncbi:hypothetical protein [Microvirga makkahensis]|uniref:Subtilase family protein n=1 Tax=Microvirga makkahensis TaxID=1128670 RepID=A0A7X3MX58_9HYPH|nr:hypothetical protein [Microvirga makkahensis]MXQ14640.1 hypothetical protein [Microvirga makkahensis]